MIKVQIVREVTFVKDEKKQEQKPELFGLQYLEEVEQSESELRGCWGGFTGCVDDKPIQLQ